MFICKGVPALGSFISRCAISSHSVSPHHSVSKSTFAECSISVISIGSSGSSAPSAPLTSGSLALAVSAVSVKKQEQEQAVFEQKEAFGECYVKIARFKLFCTPCRLSINGTKRPQKHCLLVIIMIS